ncbi:MAG: hypothetical protein WAK17_16300 [Candidatus Nitrosopolaris sp.]
MGAIYYNCITSRPCWRKEHSQVLQRFVTTNDGNGISMLLNRLDPYLKNKGVRYLIKAAIESTRNLWINMYGAYYTITRASQRKFT